mmetsp:Transcript_3826/g.7970  ORF Transcript_3826/g.7970 Transcript_3826/m.7970 type:complete len:221 (+) Transcript_3826:516-1178(+)
MVRVDDGVVPLEQVSEDLALGQFLQHDIRNVVLHELEPDVLLGQRGAYSDGRAGVGRREVGDEHHFAVEDRPSDVRQPRLGRVHAGRHGRRGCECALVLRRLGRARSGGPSLAAAAVAAATALTDLTALTECRSCHPRHPCLWPWIRRWADRRRSQPRTHRRVRRRSPSARAAAGRSGLKARRRPPVRRPPARAPRDGDAGCPSRNLSCRKSPPSTRCAS